MANLKLYGTILSPSVRTVLLTLNELSLGFEFIQVNVFKGDHKTDDFIKKNPQQSIPVLEDGAGKFIWDSHAIAAYLVRKYGKTDSLYPKDFYQRAVVDQRLHFESGILFPKLKDLAVSILFKNLKSIPEETTVALYEGLDFLEKFLVREYVAGDSMTIADFSIVSTVSTCDALIPIDPTRTPKVDAWIRKMSELPYYENVNGKGAAMLSEMIKAKLSSP